MSKQNPILILLLAKCRMSIVKKHLMPLVAGCLVMALNGCASTARVTDFKGLSTPEGTPVAHVYVSKTGLHLFGRIPLIGRSSIEDTARRFFVTARTLNGENVRIVYSNKTVWWFVLPPFTFILSPVTTTVSGDVLSTA